jgi:hypothetical protein
MAATIVFILLALLVAYFIFRAKRSHRVGQSEFLAIVQRAADGTGDFAEYRRLVHNPIFNNPELEATRGRLVHLDDKHGRGKGEPLSDAHRQDVAAVADELRRA